MLRNILNQILLRIAMGVPEISDDFSRFSREWPPMLTRGFHHLGGLRTLDFELPPEAEWRDPPQPRASWHRKGQPDGKALTRSPMPPPLVGQCEGKGQVGWFRVPRSPRGQCKGRGGIPQSSRGAL